MGVDQIDNFEELQSAIKSKDKLLVKFEADWCMPCKALKPVFETVASVNEDTAFVSINIEAEGMHEALEMYNVYSLPTIIKFVNGNIDTIKSGTLTKDQLNSLVQNEG